MTKIFRGISTILSVIYLLLLVFLQHFYEGIHFSGLNILVILSVFLLIPISNLYKNKIKVINNPIYYVVQNIILLILICFETMSLYKSFNSTYEGYLYLFDYIYLFGILIIISYIISLLFKKEVHLRTKNNTLFLYCIILLSSIIELSSYNVGIGLINVILVVTKLIMSIILIIKINDIISKNEYQKIYFILILMSIINIDIISTILYIELYINLDKYGLNI